jgi:hypothetical protein
VGRAVTACAALIVLVPGSAAADVGVVVIEAREAPERATAVTGAFVAAIEATGEAAVARPADDARAALADGAIPAGDLAAFARVAELIDEGWRAYLEVQTEFAVARLGEARRQAEAVLALDGGLAAYAEAALRLGAALDNAGRHGEADDVLRLAGLLDPGRAVTVQEFSPDVVAATERARSATRATRRVRLRARGVDGAELEVDGAVVGRGEAEIALEVGQHVVVARGAGVIPRGETISVAAGEDVAEITVEVDADPRPAALARGPRGDEAELTAWAEAVATYADLRGLVLVSAVWRSGRPALLAQWCDGAPLGCTAIVEIGYQEGGLRAAARTALDDLGQATGGRRYAVTLPGDPRVERGGRPIDGGRCRWCRPALYAGAGVALIATAAAIYLIATAEDENPIVTLNPDDFLP